MSTEARLTELKLVLPPAPRPLAVYKPLMVVGNLVFVSGHGPVQNDGTLIVGRVGESLDPEQGKNAARQTGLTMLASLRAHFGSLDRIKRVVKLLGWVNCTEGFTEQPAIINGCSELFQDLWGGEVGVGARSAIGTNVLPGNIPVEIEGIFEI